MMAPLSPTAPEHVHARRNRLLAAFLVAIAAYLRFQHLDAGIPHAIGIDEPQIMERAVGMMKSGDFNPRFFDWPSLTIYLHLIVACFTFLSGAMDGVWRHLDQVSPADMYLNGRALTALIGTATVWFVYLIGTRWGQRHGLVAAAICAVVPSHVRESHFVLADVPTAFLTTLTLWLALRAHERTTLARFALAGAAVGLAASAKYNGVVAMVVPLAVAWLSAGTLAERMRRAAVIVGAAIAAFLLGTPYALLDLPTFLNDYARLAAIFARERPPGNPGWAIYLRHLELALGRPALWLTGIGLVGAFWRTIAGPSRARWAAVGLFPPFYFHVMAGSYQIYGRYLMPLLPFASLLAAAAILAIVERLSRTRLRPTVVRLAAVALVGAALAPPAYASVEFTRQLGRQSTMDLAYDWIQQHAGRGSRVVIERQALQLSGTVYDVVHLRSLIERTHAEYVADDVDYLLASSDGYGAAFSGAASRDEFQAYQTLFTQAEPLATFTPSATRPGPELRIYGIKK